jgi:hypothetical protein
MIHEDTRIRTRATRAIIDASYAVEGFGAASLPKICHFGLIASGIAARDKPETRVSWSGAGYPLGVGTRSLETSLRKTTAYVVS